MMAYRCEKIKFIQNFKILCIEANQQLLTSTTHSCPPKQIENVFIKIGFSRYESNNHDDDFEIKNIPKDRIVNKNVRERTFMCSANVEKVFTLQQI
jgi:hypothetical protein